MKVEYPDRFKDLLKQFHGSEAPDNYIGCGNPNAKILIIGKEEGTTFYGDKSNFVRWEENFKWKYTRDNVDDWFDWTNCQKSPETRFNPIAPYNGEEFRGQKSKNKHTNPTYYNYQRLINLLLPSELQAKNGDKLNFYDYCFITELSTFNKKLSGGNNDNNTYKSIKNRLFDEKGILRHPFFQEFPIIILAVHHYHEYFKKEKINIIDVMGTKNEMETKNIRYTYKGIITQSKEFAGQLPVYKTNSELGSKFINYHVCEDINHPHLLLHTNHFCMTTKAFIKAVADECNDFIRQYGISIY